MSIDRPRAIGCAIASLLAVWLVLSCGRAPRVEYQRLDWGSADVTAGRKLFRALCSGCHGDDGRAKTAVAEVYAPLPRNLTKASYRFRTTASGTLPLRRDILRTVAEGLPGTAMPSWKEQLDQRQLMSIVLYLETLSPRFRDPDLKPESDDILIHPEKLKAPPLTAALLARGRRVYKELKCWDCHGQRGRGDGPSAKTAKNVDGTKSDVFDFTTGNFKGGSRPVDVYRTFMTGLDGTPMPSYADSLPTEPDRWALVYYVLSLRRERGLWFYLRNRPTWREPARPGQ
jgi:cytochrome c oxidase cbb3-type subunit 2